MRRIRFAQHGELLGEKARERPVLVNLSNGQVSVCPRLVGDARSLVIKFNYKLCDNLKYYNYICVVLYTSGTTAVCIRGIQRIIILK